MTYSVVGNNRGTYDVLQYDGNEYLFIAEFINDDFARLFVEALRD